jgi:tetratricopeptide (TPR) repeat protein
MNIIGTEEIVVDLTLAQVCLDENRYEEAVKMAETCLERSPGDVEAIIILCQGLLRLGKLDRLQGLLREVDETIGRLSRVYLRLGELCQKSGLNAEYINFIHKYHALAAAISPERNGHVPEAPLAVADDDGVSEEETTDISPEFHTLTLADLYIKQGHLAEAKEVLESILVNEPGNEQVSKKLTELDKLMTVTDVTVRPAASDTIVMDVNTAIISELEGWLVRVGRVRSPAA